MLIAIWIATFFGIALWSLTCWGLHALLTLDPTRIQELKPLIEQVPYGDKIELWVPGWQTLLQFAIDVAQGLFAGIAGAAPWLAWAIWVSGSVVLVVIAGVVSLAVVLIRNEMKRPPQNRPGLPSTPR